MTLFRNVWAFFFLILATIIINSCGQNINSVDEQTDHKFTNKLIDESSPYLLQHAHNPVNWYPWGEEALAKAQEEKKLLIISIGYAACHWCHVMEKESFEDSLVASRMNEHFISIKVDREERPDIDQIYMEAAQLLNGSGGWPLNAIALPDGRPIFAGTYFPKVNWLNLLDKIQEVYEKSPEKVLEQAEQLAEGINSVGLVALEESEKEHNPQDLDSIFMNWRQIIDTEWGGQKGVQKFPMPVGQQFLLNYAYLSDNKAAKEAVLLTLNKMAAGGIFDQIGGGFARYTVDRQWKVPHFEKMLYDNSQLVSLYSAAYQWTKDPLYKQVVYKTLSFVEREFTSPEGGFYSSLDADSEGEEGKYYVWEKEEIESVLGKDASLFNEYYNVSLEGNWEEGKNILYRTKTNDEIAKKYNLSEEQLIEKIAALGDELMKIRLKRHAPPLDDKILTSWNALMLKGYVDAYLAFNEPAFLKSAIKNAEFIEKNALQEDYRLTRNYKDGKSAINAFLDDYALTAEAFISLYQASFDEKWLRLASELVNYAINHFHNQENSMFFYTSDLDPALLARKMEVNDNVIPSSNSVMAKNLYVLGEYYYKPEYVSRAKQMLNNVKADMIANGPYYGSWDILLSWIVNPPFEVAIVGEDYNLLRKEFNNHYLPNVFYMGGVDEGSLPLLENKLNEGETTIYVCQNKLCKIPVTSTSLALEQLRR